MYSILLYTSLLFNLMCIICRQEELNGLQKIDCSRCYSLTQIPKIDGLLELDCKLCIS